MTNRLDTLKQVESILNERTNIHGELENSFPQMATMWNAYLKGRDATPADTCVMMALLKIIRFRENPEHADNLIDAIGYLACASEILDK